MFIILAIHNKFSWLSRFKDIICTHTLSNGSKLIILSTGLSFTWFKFGIWNQTHGFGVTLFIINRVINNYINFTHAFHTIVSFKEIQILLCARLHVNTNLYDLLSSVEQDILKNVSTASAFFIHTMKVNVVLNNIGQKTKKKHTSFVFHRRMNVGLMNVWNNVGEYSFKIKRRFKDSLKKEKKNEQWLSD